MAKATIVDVAEYAGVSKKTVSRVLNNEPNVREATREKVQQAIEALNFKRSPLGHALARNRSYLMALVYDNPSVTFLTGLQNGIVNACQANSMGLYLHKCDYHSDTLAEDIEHMIASTSVDGLIMSSPVCDQPEVLKMLERTNIPYVSVNPKALENTLTVSVNNRQAAFEMTEYLINMGHSKIGFIKGHPDLSSSHQRELGFREAHKAYGLEPRECYIAEGMNNFISGRAAASSLLDKQDRPTAIFANNDDMAAGVLYEVQQRKLKVPEEISVAGFDNSAFSQQIWPRLTTTGQPFDDIGRTAATLLINHLKAPDDSPKKNITLACELIVRESTRANSVTS